MDDNSNVKPSLLKIQLLVKDGNLVEAAVLSERMCSEPTVDARVWQILGAIHGRNNNLEQAEFCTRQALSIDPTLSRAHHNLVILLQRQGKLEMAEQCLKEALRIRPSDATLYNELGNTYRIAGKDIGAVNSYRKAIDLEPTFRDAHYNLGNTFLDIQDLHGALGCMRAAYACDSNFVKAKAMEALILEKQGDIKGAWQCLEPWSGRDAVEPIFADAFAVVSKHLGKEQQAIDYLISSIRRKETPKEVLSGLYYRLGSLQEHLRQYDEAFYSYKQANILSEKPDNSDEFIRTIHEVRQIFTKHRMASRLNLAFSGESLVYIVGMPRSGTSLVEQILSAHSKIVAGGELSCLSQLAQSVMPELTERNEQINSLDLQTIKHYSRRHINIMNAKLGSKKRITDKMPDNFRYVGLINLLFPKAHIIHCRRSPMDTCTSCYISNFESSNLSYTNDLVSLGSVYKEYELLMDYWREDLSIPILDVPYEAVVDNIELWAKRIIKYCGLEWEKQCLDFHKINRQVHTLSYSQVRQPIYRSSVNRWTYFDKHLEPLKQILDETPINYN